MTSWLAHYGIFAIFVLMAIDAVFPAASELVMVYGGALASGALAHEVDVAGWHTTGFAAYVAVVLAGVVGYQIGSDRRLVDRPSRRSPRSSSGTDAGSTSPPAQLDRAERWFERWDAWAVLLGRVTPVARSFVSIPAGVFGSPLRALQRPHRSSATVSGASSSPLSGGRSGRAGTASTTASAMPRSLVVVGILAAAAYWIWRRRRPGTLSPP